jgi:hypothetical protein
MQLTEFKFDINYIFNSKNMTADILSHYLLVEPVFITEEVEEIHLDYEDQL